MFENIFTILFWLGGLILLVFIVIIIFRKHSVSSDVIDKDYWQQRWSVIQNYIQGNTQAEWRMAVIEADKFLDFVLKHKGIGGENLGQRLKVAQSKFKDLRAVWPAHILRNKLVHESDYNLSKSQAVKAVKSFRKAIKVLGFN